MLRDLTLRMGERGAFEVFLDGEQIFSKWETHRFPEYAEILATLTARIGPPLRPED